MYFDHGVHLDRIWDYIGLGYSSIGFVLDTFHTAALCRRQQNHARHTKWYESYNFMSGKVLRQGLEEDEVEIEGAEEK